MKTNRPAVEEQQRDPGPRGCLGVDVMDSETGACVTINQSPVRKQTENGRKSIERRTNAAADTVIRQLHGEMLSTATEAAIEIVLLRPPVAGAPELGELFDVVRVRAVRPVAGGRVGERSAWTAGGSAEGHTHGSAAPLRAS